MNVTMAGTIGSFLSPLLTTRLTIVTAAMIAANGNVRAKPQPCACGFITLIQIHITAPQYGRL